MPPVQSWHPEKAGTIDIVIKQNGDWYHEGSVISRLPLVRLFASILRLEPDGSYVLVTPVEKFTIEVEDTPFIAASVIFEDATRIEKNRIRFITNIGESIILGPEHPLVMKYRTDNHGEPRPLIEVRNGLIARISQSAWYHLVEHGYEVKSKSGRSLMVSSCGHEYCLGFW